MATGSEPVCYVSLVIGLCHFWGFGMSLPEFPRYQPACVSPEVWPRASNHPSCHFFSEHVG